MGPCEGELGGEYALSAVSAQLGVGWPHGISGGKSGLRVWPRELPGDIRRYWRQPEYWIRPRVLGLVCVWRRDDVWQYGRLPIRRIRALTSWQRLYMSRQPRPVTVGHWE